MLAALFRDCVSCRAAIRFVLSDIFTSLTATERQKLLHVSCLSSTKPLLSGNIYLIIAVTGQYCDLDGQDIWCNL